MNEYTEKSGNLLERTADLLADLMQTIFLTAVSYTHQMCIRDRLYGAVPERHDADDFRHIQHDGDDRPDQHKGLESGDESHRTGDLPCDGQLFAGRRLQRGEL